MKLHDYIGNLVASIQHARVNADLQAIRVAEDYAKHSLLEHFPVPRMRLKDVEMTIPVAVNPSQTESTTNLEPINNREFNSEAYKTVLAGLGQKRLSQTQSRAVRQTISEQTDILEKAILKDGQTQALGNFARVVAKASIDSQAKTEETADEQKARIAALADKLNQQLSGAIKPINPEQLLADLDVAIETDILREKPKDSLVNIKLVIQEEGVEWHKMENQDGQLTRKLIPE